jgi:hypothetical protein
MDASLRGMKAWQKETTACQEVMAAFREKDEAYLERKGPAPVEMIITAHPEGLN